ncbi:hypothetical protein [Cystobacter fuscus]|uniref:hypothetical protein n=1 Tax=Cystobacter fuscus TaxID=43 RepID=UPI002B2B72E9|nr:hypothetical protein F0U63_03550 [Cystobacter fuscus]
MKPSNRKTRGQVLGVAAAALAWGTAATAQPQEQYLTLRTPQSAITARITGDSITSADIQLTRQGQELRGRMFGRVVFLGLEADEVGGTVGDQLTRLHLQERDGVTQARGNFLGTLMNLSLGPQSLTGSVGRCGYNLKVTPEGTYQGSRSCGGTPQRPVVLSLPPALTQQGPAMTLTTLAILLGNA